MKVFWCEETTRCRRHLRIYAEGKCVDDRWHNAMTFIDEVERKSVSSKSDPEDMVYENVGNPEDFLNDPRWPIKCEKCEHVFTDKDAHQIFTRQLKRRTDTGELMTEEELPPGAMWSAQWLSRWGGYTGPDGRSVHVKCPDGHIWCVDGRASNCTMPDDNEHKCWVRHGDVTKSEIHVDKNGVTCAAGAGSIDTGKWHGYLHNSDLHT